MRILILILSEIGNFGRFLIKLGFVLRFKKIIFVVVLGIDYEGIRIEGDGLVRNLW